MLITVLVYEIYGTYSGYSGVYSAGNFIHSIYNDATNEFTVEIRSSKFANQGSLIASPTTGPNLISDTSGDSELITTAPFYSYCDGTTLVSFTERPIYPYSTAVTTVNASECQIVPVCDLNFSNDVSITPTTSLITADGSFTVVATSSNGTVKYSLDEDFDYATEGNTTGIFINKISGTYTVYAKDSLGCIDSIDVVLPVTREYNPRWVLEYDRVKGGTSRVSILERGYDGASSDVCGSDEPFILEYDYDKLVFSSCTINLLVETDGEFDDFIDADDRQFKIQYYHNDVLKWSGFVIPELISFPHLATPYYLTITGTDGLKDASEEDFYDINGNRFKQDIKISKLFSDFLKFTDLELNIRFAIDIFETNMVESDDPFNQLLVPPGIFYETNGNPKKWIDALEAILAPFKATIMQSNGLWWVLRDETKTKTSFDYFEFDSNGDYLSTDSYSPRHYIKPPDELDKTYFIERSQLITSKRNYGKFRLTHNLAKDQNLIDEGSFEEYYIEDRDGSQFFKNWNFTIGQTGFIYGFESVSNGDSSGAFFAKYNTTTNAQNDSVLYSKEIPVFFGQRDLFRLKFQILISPYYNVPHIRVGWRIRVNDNSSGDYFDLKPPFGDNLQFTVNEEFINDLYISEYGKFIDFDLGYFGLGAPIEDCTIQVSFFFHNHYGRDYDDYDDFRLELVSEYNNGVKRYFNNGTETLLYELKWTEDAESEPSIIRPIDYNGTTNSKQWVLQDTISLGPNTSLLQKILIDNVKLSYFPFVQPQARNIDPPETVVFEQSVNRANKAVYKQSFSLGDLPDISNALYLYNGYFKLLDGTPTESWYNLGVSESRYLLEILLRFLTVQLNSAKRTLNCSVLSDNYIHYVDSFVDNTDDRKYINTRFLLSDKKGSHELELVEVITGGDGEPPASTAAFTTGFSSGFNP